MIALTRLPEPTVLTEKKATWTEKLLAKRADDPKARPASSTYAHRDIVAALAAMSHWKCFYCERSLKGQTPEVDHYHEVADRPELAFAWENLYLACGPCNDKLSGQQLPPAACLDPCAPGCAPEEHLTFDDDQIRPRAGSALGASTIRKYRLDDERRDYLRGRQLREFLKAQHAIDEARIRDGGRALSADELELLRGFADRSQPYSLMFTVHLRRAGLLP